MVEPRLWRVRHGYRPDHPYVRRYWTAALGPGAVADLLRLIQAAERSQRIRRPTTASALARVGLLVEDAGVTWVRSLVPPVPSDLLRRLPQVLQREIGTFAD